MLALSKHLLCNPRILRGKCKLFEGSNQYERFNSILRSIVQSDEYRNEFIDFGVHPKYFGTHSMRKGAASHVACGITSCPPIASICIRANWCMPGVMNRYIKYKGAGDQYVGRCVSGRNRLGKGFAESLPYFDFSHLDSAQKGLKRREVDQWVKPRMPGDTSNESVFALFMTCIASFIYHKSWLDETVHPENAL